MTVTACPFCDRTSKYHRRKRSHMGPKPWAGDPDKRFHCANCGNSFDEPVEREERTRETPPPPEPREAASVSEDLLDRVDAKLGRADP